MKSPAPTTGRRPSGANTTEATRGTPGAGVSFAAAVPGEQARTVVLQTLSDGTTVEVLEDKVTDPNQRPLVQIHLPNHEGWLVASGPNSVITGWRAPGGEWHKVASKQSMLLPDGPGVELRISRR